MCFCVAVKLFVRLWESVKREKHRLFHRHSHATPTTASENASAPNKVFFHVPTFFIPSSHREPADIKNNVKTWRQKSSQQCENFAACVAAMHTQKKVPTISILPLFFSLMENTACCAKLCCALKNTSMRTQKNAFQVFSTIICLFSRERRQSPRTDAECQSQQHQPASDVCDIFALQMTF